MKKKRLNLTTFCLLFAGLIYGQPDLQWMIWNAKGKESVNTGSPTTNNFANLLTSTMTFSGVTIPDLNYDPNARNNLLIIYDDFTHQNTRGVSGLPVFFAGMPSPTVTPVLFNAPAGTNILYGYQTNIYEQDDLPTNVRINSVGGPPPIALGVTTPTEVISANHEVVYLKDITLIINNGSLLQAQDNNGKEPNVYTLLFDGIQEIATSAITTGVNFLDQSNVFGTSLTALSPLLPIPVSNPVSGESITLDPTSGPYSYVNLRPNSAATTYQPGRDNVARFNALFRVYKNGSLVDDHIEPLRFSHDPNFLQVLSIYNTSDGGYMVTYHLEFENTSTTPTTYLHATADFPAHFDLSDIDAVDWSAKGSRCRGRLRLDPTEARRIIFDIEDHQLLKCTRAAPEQGKGVIEFKVKVNPGYDVLDISNSLELTNPNVFFDSIPYLITDFRDLIQCESRHSNEPAFTYEPNNPENPEAKFVNGPKGLTQVCSRSVSEPPATTPWWICVLGGLLLLALIVFLIYLIMRKKPTPASPSPES